MTIIRPNTSSTQTISGSTISNSIINNSTISGSTIDFQSNTVPNNVMPASFIGYKSGSNYKVRNVVAGTTTSNTDAATVFQACLDTIKNTGRRLSLMGNTKYILSTSLIISAHQQISGESTMGLAELQANGDYPAIILQESTSGGAGRLEIANLYLTHNQPTYSGGVIEFRTTTGHSLSTADIHGCYFYDYGQGTGNAIRYAPNDAPIYKTNVYNCEMRGFAHQIYIKFVTGGANDWCNNHTFISVNHWFPVTTTLKVDSPSGAAFDGNNFINCFTQSGAANDGYDFSTSHTGHSFYTGFTNCFVWDLASGKDGWKFNGISEVTMTGCVPDWKVGGTGATNGKVVRHSIYTYKNGNATFSGNASTTAFTVNTGLPISAGSITPTLRNIQIQPQNVDTIGDYYFTSTDASAFTVNYTIAPPTGTNNIKFYWEVNV